MLNTICSPRPRKDVPLDRLRDPVLFGTIYRCGTRAAEACVLNVEDFDLRTDDEHVRSHGKGGTVRTVLLDDRDYVALLKLYLNRAGYRLCKPHRRCTPRDPQLLHRPVAAGWRWAAVAAVAAVALPLLIVVLVFAQPSVPAGSAGGATPSQRALADIPRRTARPRLSRRRCPPDRKSHRSLSVSAAHRHTRDAQTPAVFCRSTVTSAARGPRHFH
ncbi:tyrosine-type recombinase/integrase [Microbispora sp. GKU 823]|uniref:tyrosine-type recombinase/integrase n=1 Tax=Microbispora sp. GKU 823 TaxID=1652100 RepID=UPI002117DF32|nr:tyrosine-type recombinase/integrase [Microbispora sp. GKU 823]